MNPDNDLNDTNEDLKNALTSFTAYLLDGNRQGCRIITEELLSKGTPVPSLYQDIFQPALYRIGELWEMNRISVAREHIATSIVESMLSLTFPLICNASPTGRKVLVACTPGELHQLGARMVADTLEMHGWDTSFSGANTPATSIVHHLAETRPDLLCLSLSTHMNLSSLLQTIAQVREKYSDIPIAVGGKAFRGGWAEKLSEFQGVRHGASLSGLEEMIRSGR